MGSAGWALAIELVKNAPEIISRLESLFGAGRGAEKKAVADGQLKIAEAEHGVVSNAAIDKARSALIDAQVAYANAVEQQQAGEK